MAWSTARMPVVAQRGRGVVAVTSGSRNTTFGVSARYAATYLTPLASSTVPAKPSHSAAESVVGTESTDAAGAVSGRTHTVSGYSKWTAKSTSSSVIVMFSATPRAANFAESTTDPAPTAT